MIDGFIEGLMVCENPYLQLYKGNFIELLNVPHEHVLVFIYLFNIFVTFHKTTHSTETTVEP
jgi:hypothetical protein